VSAFLVVGLCVYVNFIDVFNYGLTRSLGLVLLLVNVAVNCVIDSCNGKQSFCNGQRLSYNVECK
jgi:hypothetical protein